jgi:hypothetical protein
LQQYFGKKLCFLLPNPINCDYTFLTLEEIMKKTLVALSAIATLAIGSAAPAMAYPAGKNPTLSLSSVSRLTPGDNVSVVVSRVKRGCNVALYWVSGSMAITSATVKTTGKTPVMTIATPTTAGTYTLKTGTISGECSGGSAVSLAKAISVGKLASIVAKVSTTSGFIAKNPTMRISGTVKSGSVAVANKEVTVSLRLAGNQVKTLTAQTNSSGVFSENFVGTSYEAGSYTAVVSLAADSTFSAKSTTTAALKLR